MFSSTIPAIHHALRADPVDKDPCECVAGIVLTGLLLALLFVLVGTHSAHAQYAEQTGSDNPFDGFTATSTPPALDALAADFDTDGDVELLTYDGASEHYYDNDGTGTFTEKTGSENPFDGLSSAFGTRGRTYVRDLDADGHLDLVTFDYTGGGSGTLVFVENTGGATYARRTGGDNPFDGIPVTGNQATVDAVMGDFSGNGAPDLLVYDGSTERYYENDGSGTFTEQTGSDNPFDGVSTAFWTKATTLVRDFDGDGDVDLAFRDGTGDATAWQYREHTASGFVARTGSDNPLRDVAADATAKSVALATGDFDLDGHLDLLTYDDGTQRYYDGDGSGTFTEPSDGSSPFSEADPALRVHATTFVRDVEPDDDPDLGFANADENALRFVERENAGLALTGGSESGLDFTAEASPGTENNAVGVLGLSATHSGAVLDGLTVTTNAPGIEGISAARLFWSDDQVLDPGTDTQLDEVTTDAQNAPSTIAFDGFTRWIPTATRYLIAAIDVTAEASDAEVQFVLEQPADLSEGGGTLTTVNGQSQTTFSSLLLSNGAAPLPVELAGFDGRATEDGVQLRWKTASEQSNAGFRILRKVGTTFETSDRNSEEPSRRDDSTEGWQTIGRREGAGTTSAAQTYRFTDTDLPYSADSVAYRLKQVDADGSTSLTDPVTVARSGPDQLQLLGTAPNPARQRATVRYGIPESTEGPVRLRLYDVLGRHERRLDVSGLSSGMYVLRLSAGGRSVARKLTVVQ